MIVIVTCEDEDSSLENNAETETYVNAAADKEVLFITEPNHDQLRIKSSNKVIKDDLRVLATEPSLMPFSSPC